MNNPCIECIVRGMCESYCQIFKEYVDSHFNGQYYMLGEAAYNDVRKTLFKTENRPKTMYGWNYKVSKTIDNPTREPAWLFRILMKEGEIYDTKPLF